MTVMGRPPLSKKPIANVHYGTNSLAAFWNGEETFFGDGNEDFFPLTSLDLVGHEVAHGFTEQNSGLSACQCVPVTNTMCPACRPCPESATLNEAFSDMAGEALKHFTFGQTDWQFGRNVTKFDGPIRNTKEPALSSQPGIDHALLWSASLDPHEAGGVFTRAFYWLATSPGWDPVRAFSAFAHANAWLWTSATSLEEGARDVLDAAQILSLPTCDVRAAFAHVGLLDGGGFDRRVIPDQSGLRAEQGRWLHFQINLGDFAVGNDKKLFGMELVVVIFGFQGDADLYVIEGDIPPSQFYYNADQRPFRCGPREAVHILNPRAGPISIGVFANCAFEQLTLRTTLVAPLALQPNLKYVWHAEPFQPCPICPIKTIFNTREVTCRAIGVGDWARTSSADECSADEYLCPPIAPSKQQTCLAGCLVPRLLINHNTELTSAEKGSWHFLKIVLEPDEVNMRLEIGLSIGTGDADLFVLAGGDDSLLPTLTRFTYSSVNSGNVESIEIEPANNTVYYVGVNAYKAYEKPTILALVRPAYHWLAEAFASCDSECDVPLYNATRKVCAPLYSLMFITFLCFLFSARPFFKTVTSNDQVSCAFKYVQRGAADTFCEIYASEARPSDAQVNHIAGCCLSRTQSLTCSSSRRCVRPQECVHHASFA
jgi:hypothetical protein